MVTSKVTIYVLEKDHRLEEYCEELNVSPNSLPLDKFINAAQEIGWTMTAREYERLNNTSGLPNSHYIRIIC